MTHAPSPTDRPPPNPGTAFDPESGKLYRFERYEDSWQIEVLRTWPDPRAWYKTQAVGRWKGYRPTFSLTALPEPPVVPTPGPRSRAERWTTNHRQAIEQVPAELLEVIRAFPGESHWSALNLLARAPALLERAEELPQLIFLLANSRYFRTTPVQRPYRSARALARRRNTDILRWLEWPDRPSTLRVLRRLATSGARLCDFYRLRDLLRGGEKWLHHLPALTPSALMLLTYHRPFVSFSLVDEIANKSNEGWRAGLASRFRFYRRLHGELRPGRRFPRFRSIEELEAFGLDLCDQGRHLEDRMMDPGQALPDPPFPGEGPGGKGGLVIQPLCSVREVILHASKMRNCLARSPSHMRPMLSGEAAAYAVKWNEPETGVELEATAFLEQVLPGSWELTDIALKRNEPSPPVLTQKVFNWVFQRNEALRGDRSPPGSCGSEFADEDVDPRQLPFPWCSCSVHAKSAS